MKYDGRKYRPRCEDYGIFLSYDADSYTPYGCSSYDPPEPYDPSYLCKKHSDESYAHFLKAFKDGSRYGDWCKSNAEIRAAKECGLAWVGSSGIGTLGTKDFVSAINTSRRKNTTVFQNCLIGDIALAVEQNARMVIAHKTFAQNHLSNSTR